MDCDHFPSVSQRNFYLSTGGNNLRFTELSGATRNKSISTYNTYSRKCTRRASRGALSGDGARYLRNSTRLSLIVRINRSRRIPRKPPRNVYRRADTAARAWVDIPLVSGRAFCSRVPPPTVPPSPCSTPGGNIFSRLGRGQRATLSRHGNGKRYSSCFRDTLTENTRVSSTYVLSRGQDGPCGCAAAMSDWGWPET